MSQFNVDLAKAGRPIECRSGIAWAEVWYVGPWDDNHVVCQVPWSYEPVAVAIDQLRMADEPGKEVWFKRDWLSKDGMPDTAWRRDQKDFDGIFPTNKWLGPLERVEILVKK